MSSRASGWPCPQPPTTVFDKVAADELNNGPRAQKTDRAEEEEVHEKNDALAGLKRPLVGMRQAPLSEVARPQ